MEFMQGGCVPLTSWFKPGSSFKFCIEKTQKKCPGRLTRRCDLTQSKEYLCVCVPGFISAFRMRSGVVLQFSALVIIVLITWAISNNTFDVHKTARDLFGVDYFELKEEPTPPVQMKKCDLQKSCPPDTYAVRIKSGAANVVGPTICFDGQNVMSHVMNNVGPGLNVVVVNIETGAVEKFGFLNSKDVESKDILDYFKKIELGRIVLLASFDDVTPKLTDEIRDVLESMGSTLIKTVKSKDNWVFAGTPGAAEKSPFEKLAVNDPKKNAYEDWPEVVEINGCFPKNTKS